MHCKNHREIQGTYGGYHRTLQQTSDKKDDADCDVTQHSFIQGDLGNCGMISAMATLPSNRELYSQVIPKKISNFAAKYNSSKPELEFNIYKFGKLHKVVIDENGKLKYSKSSKNGTLSGP